MYKLQFFASTCLLLALISFSQYSNAKPANRLDDDLYKPLGSPLPSGYYFVDNGVISSVSASTLATGSNRRQDTVSGSQKKEQFRPLVKIKQVHIQKKRKKLFVPNFFG